MSLFNDASLVMIPSGYKNQKVYSVKPTDGTGDLTFSRASSATRVQSDGLIEKVRTNIQTHSQNFSNAVWVKSAGATLTHSQTDPNGGTTASRLQMPSGTSNFLAASPIGGLTNGGKYTHSIYMKSNTGSTQSVRLLDGVRGVAGGSLTASVTTSWQRFDVVITTASTSAGLQIDNNAGTFANDILIAFAQTEESDFGATAYIATTTAAVSVGPVSGLPRLDYLGSTCPRLLLEGQRSNIFLNSESASAQPITGTVTISSNSAVSPSGYADADQITADSTGFLRPTLTVSTGTNFVWSVFLKNVNSGGSILFARRLVTAIQVNISWSGSVPTASVATGTGTVKVVPYGNDWYRFEIATTSVEDLQNLRIYPSNGASASVLFWGGQVETSATYATSYIPTLGASVTRVADVASKTGISSLIGQTEGTIFAEINLAKLLGIQSRYILVISDNTANNRIYIAFSGSSSNILRARIFSAGVQQISIDTATISSLGKYKLALAYNNNDAVLYVNGVQIGTDTSVTIPACSQLNVCTNQAGASPFDDGINQALLFKTRLTNSQLAELTTL
jgi:hypothetical protein